MTPEQRGDHLARDARLTGIREIRNLIDGIRARNDTVAMIVDLPKAEHALARLEHAETQWAAANQQQATAHPPLAEEAA